MIALVCVVVVCTSRRVGRSSGVWCSGGASALSACTRLGAGGLSLAQGRVAGRCGIGTFGCVLLEAIDARDGSGRDRVYEERRCFAAFSVCKAFTFTAQGRGGAGRCFMPTSGVRLLSCRYALREDRTAREADGVRFALARTSCSGRVREDIVLWLKGLVVECRGGCARCRDASEGACHNKQADCVDFHVRLHLRHSVGTSRA